MMRSLTVGATLVTFSFLFGIIYLAEIQVITMDRYVWVIIFLLVVTAGLFVVFDRWYQPLLKETKVSEVVVLIGASLLIHGLTVYFITHYAERPDWPFSDRGTSFLLLNNYYIWAKPLDIVAQQMLIIWLTMKLHSQGFSLRKIIGLFIGFFGAIHIFQVMKTDVVIGLLFTTGAVLFSIIFPYLILRVRNGYLYNFMLHLVVYNIAALVAWFWY